MEESGEGCAAANLTLLHRVVVAPCCVYSLRLKQSQNHPVIPAAQWHEYGVEEVLRNRCDARHKRG